YFQTMIETDKVYIVFGKPTLFNLQINMSHPEITLEEKSYTWNQIPFMPMYNSTDKCKKNGLDSRGIEKLCKTLIDNHINEVQETLPDYIREKLQLIDKCNAIKQIHFPSNAEEIKQATRRLKFEEIFFMQIFLLQIYNHNSKNKGYLISKVGTLFNTFYHQHLPFPLTNAQKRVIKEIRADFLTGKQMNRLLQGDVGSGKTVTALLVMLLAIDNGFQCCLMAPTEILAQQHYNTIQKLLADMPIEVRLLTGSTKTAERKDLLPQTANGNIHILIGTHALCEDTVVFKKLGLAIIDEQHRFGVEQRAKLWKKSLIAPHVLVMTATPIPRTLAMTVYGDLDLSVIDELPVGRKPVKTIHFYKKDSGKINQFLRAEIDKGRQIFVVYPLIEESEKLTLSNLIDGYEEFKQTYPEPKYRVSYVHGKMSAEEKDAQMLKFKQGETHILLATTVIEVGIDVPNASVMVIVNAERFGLSQLHQLRGRVGRGSEQSYCVLITDYQLSNDARKRMEAMVNTNNGFEIADVDLKLRGPGDLSGTQQSGILHFKLLNIIEDERIISAARDIAKNILNDDPNLEKEKNQLLKIQIESLKSQRKNYYQIG
ncbi:MAG: ATP-dependent DNA helicase RecG, partial [Bacteroidales bacterium]|nr:ATP-dependent DNA helicase RecG [Bacteroidales bacterium]